MDNATELEITSDIVKLICSEYLAPLPTLFLYQRVCKSWQQSLITVLEEQGPALFQHLHFGINMLTPLLAKVREDVDTNDEEKLKHQESEKKPSEEENTSERTDGTNEAELNASILQSKDSNAFIINTYGYRLEIKRYSHTYFHSFLDSFNKFGIGKHVKKITLPSIRIGNELIYLLCKYFVNLQHIVFALCEPATFRKIRELVDWKTIGLELSKERSTDSDNTAPYSIKQVTLITHEKVEKYYFKRDASYLLSSFIKNQPPVNFYTLDTFCPDWLQFIDLFEYDDPSYVSLLKTYSIENEIPKELHTQRFLIDMSEWDEYDDEEFNETYIHPMVNILTEQWKGDIEHFYKNNILSIHQVLSSRLGYNIGHALAASLWFNLHENINQKRITEENVTKWRNSQTLKNILEGLKYLISRGLNVVTKKDKFKGLTILQMIQMSDRLVKNQGWSICPTLLDEVKEMIRLHSVSNVLEDFVSLDTEQTTKKKRKKKEEDFSFEEEEIDGDEESYDEEEQDYSPKKKKKKQSKKSSNTRKTSSRKKK
ncbi:hypothetical protein C9374_009203 [Naegleria lovaniensis]|uniref:Uncharacterized protein n=1 Tax=Naegleria lovaniensis TaxID=51637 RepID=A0AA88GHX1_NAELO|nr:uncharacterized protein C9374_009203 [Naegleria lovaniensis]KAG2377687.1 hypothetical protein C9374_009203 [Naegleria lovaniensis]